MSPQSCLSQCVCVSASGFDHFSCWSISLNSNLLLPPPPPPLWLVLVFHISVLCLWFQHHWYSDLVVCWCIDHSTTKWNLCICHIGVTWIILHLNFKTEAAQMNPPKFRIIQIVATFHSIKLSYLCRSRGNLREKNILRERSVLMDVSTIYWLSWGSSLFIFHTITRQLSLVMFVSITMTRQGSGRLPAGSHFIWSFSTAW